MEEEKAGATKAVQNGAAGGDGKGKNGSGINLDHLNITEDYLVTYREFMQAIRSLKGPGSLYHTLLPRTISFQDVLYSRPTEKVYNISDVQLDDFYMFRYEMNTIFQKHLFQNEKNNDSSMFLLGRKPLSHADGVPVKEKLTKLKQQFAQKP